MTTFKYKVNDRVKERNSNRIHGGYIDNKAVRFGVNCFGPKPIFTENDEIYMENLKYQPVTKESVYVKNKTEKYKQQLNEIVVAPFNNDTWSLTHPVEN